jgi:hypothetical protein
VPVFDRNVLRIQDGKQLRFGSSCLAVGRILALTYHSFPSPDEMNVRSGPSMLLVKICSASNTVNIRVGRTKNTWAEHNCNLIQTADSI